MVEEVSRPAPRYQLGCPVKKVVTAMAVGQSAGFDLVERVTELGGSRDSYRQRENRRG